MHQVDRQLRTDREAAGGGDSADVFLLGGLVAFTLASALGGAVGLLLGGVLTEFLSWRWTMYVNVLIAAAAGVGVVIYMVSDRPAVRARIDLVGALLASAGLFGLVFGFSHAESAGWTSVVTLTWLILGVALLVAFGFAEARVVAPLLPLRVVSDRSRAAAFGALAVSGFAMFGLFLFLTYYLQTVRGFSPLTSGLAFLPMIGYIILSANLANTVTMPRFGPRVVITTGMIVGGLALAYLSLLDVNSSYTAGVLPSLIGMGMIVALFCLTRLLRWRGRRGWPGRGRTADLPLFRVTLDRSARVAASTGAGNRPCGTPPGSTGTPANETASETGPPRPER